MFNFWRGGNNKTAKRTIGDTGEAVAVKYLNKHGYIVLDKNYLRPWGEIDIVAKKGERLQFVEVKTVCRASYDPGAIDDYGPEDNLTLDKKKRLYKAINSYLAEKKLGEWEWQLGACLVYLETGTLKPLNIEFIEEI